MGSHRSMASSPRAPRRRFLERIVHVLVMRIAKLPDPQAGPGQVRVAVHAAGINPTWPCGTWGAPADPDQPGDWEALGRSRGGYSTKLHFGWSVGASRW